MQWRSQEKNVGRANKQTQASTRGAILYHIPPQRSEGGWNDTVSGCGSIVYTNMAIWVVYWAIGSLNLGRLPGPFNTSKLPLPSNFQTHVFYLQTSPFLLKTQRKAAGSSILGGKMEGY
jgi:hypothetical protein